MIKKQVTRKQWLLMGVLSTSLMLSGCKEGSNPAIDAVEWTSDKIGTLIDNHEYKEFPWDVFLTEEDRALLAVEAIEPLPEIGFEEVNPKETLASLSESLTEVSPYLNDQDTYFRFLDDITILQAPFKEVFGSSDAYSVFAEVLKDMYNRDFTYPHRLDLVQLEQVKTSDGHEWVAYIEWKAVQDSEEFLIYPLTLRLDEKLSYLEAGWKSPSEKTLYTRPLEGDAFLEENIHQPFLQEWGEFKRKFNKKEGTDQTDMSHLESLSSESFPIKALKHLYEASRGDLENGSFTSWKVHDKNAEALSIYTFSIPLDNEGRQTSVEIIYSRTLADIQSINIKAN